MTLSLSAAGFIRTESRESTLDKRKAHLSEAAKKINHRFKTLFGLDDRSTAQKVKDGEKKLEKYESKLDSLNNERQGDNLKKRGYRRAIRITQRQLAKDKFLLGQKDRRSSKIMDGIKEILAEDNNRRTTLGKISVLFDDNPPISDDFKPGFIPSKKKEENLQQNLLGSEYKLLKIQDILDKGGDERTMFEQIEKVWYGENSITAPYGIPYSISKLF